MDSKSTPPNVPRTIWLVNLYFGPGPAPTGVLLDSLAVYLQRHGWQLEVLTGTAEYRAEGAQEASLFQGKIHRFRCQSKRSGVRGKFLTWAWFYLQLAWFVLWRRMPQAVIVETTPPFLHTLFAIRCLFCWRRRYLILWNQDTYPEMLAATDILRETSLAYRTLKWVAGWSGRRVAAAVALDGAMVDRLRGQGIRHVEVIPNWDVVNTNAASTSTAIDLDRQGRGTRGVPAALPPTIASAANDFRYKIAYTGNLGKGHDLTPLWNFIKKNPAQKDFLFLFVGEGERTKELKAMVEQDGWQCVKFSPYLPASEFNDLLIWADYGLVALELRCLGLMSPSKMHAWLGAGKPVLYVGPEGSNVTEAVRAYDCGFVVDPRDPLGFDRVADQMLSDRFDFVEMSERARKAWRERHAPEVGLEAWRQLVERACSDPIRRVIGERQA
jgi:colanic acid biosynthesis glycosyl transferase WcaI